jgi:hypothetical protein
MKTRNSAEQEIAEAEAHGEKFGLPSFQEVLAKRFFANVETGPKSATQLKKERLTRTVADIGVQMLEWFKEKIKAHENLQRAWDAVEFEDKYRNGSTECPLLIGAPRLARGKQLDATKMLPARNEFLASPVFEQYRETDESQTARFQLQRQIVGEIVEFGEVNRLDMQQASGWAFALAILTNVYEWKPLPKVVPPQPEPLSKSEQAIIDHQRYIDEVVGVDELGKQWTEAELDELPAKEALRLRRLFEKGHRGDSRLDTYREVQDIKQRQEAERAR